MIKLGVTGGIGSGKSVACEFLSLLDIPVFDSDAEAKEIMNRSDSVCRRLCSLLGSETYRNGELNREFVAKRVFTDKSLIEQVNAVVHPAVINAYEKWCERWKGKPITVCESAILFECGMNRRMDKIILVEAPIEERITRVVKRSGLNREEIVKRIDNQQPDDLKREACDFVLCNSFSEPMIPRLLEIIQNINPKH